VFVDGADACDSSSDGGFDRVGDRLLGVIGPLLCVEGVTSVLIMFIDDAPFFFSFFFSFADELKFEIGGVFVV
jgi:hypothetical protein